jgi:hypothetical protein
MRMTVDADLTRRIRTINAGSPGTGDAPHIHAELRAEGVVVGYVVSFHEMLRLLYLCLPLTLAATRLLLASPSVD